jgi:VWFA-related protein
MRGLFLLLLILHPAMARAQTIGPEEIQVRSGPYRPRSQYALKVDTRLVEVDVVVRDSRGHPVAGLERKDFEITDQGKKREIAAFTVLTAAAPATTTPAVARAETPTAPPAAPAVIQAPPRFVGMVFDDISMNGPELFQSKAGAKRFVNEAMASSDQAAIFTVSGGLTAAFTRDKDKLLAAIDKVNIHPRAPDAGLCPKLTPYDSYLIANNLDQNSLEVKVGEAMRCSGEPSPRGRTLPARYVAMVQGLASANWAMTKMTSQSMLGSLQGIVDFMAHMPGKRVVLLASSGFLANTLEAEQEQLIRHALHGGVVVNAIDAKGLFVTPAIDSTPGGNAQSVIRAALLGTRGLDTANDTVATLAYGTGGLFFHNRNDLEQGFQELGMIPETSYLLAFAPDVPDNKYRKLKVRLTSGNHGTVQARSGYFASLEKESAPETERPIDRVIMGSEAHNDVAVGIAPRVGKTDKGETVVQAVFHLDVASLRFAERSGVRSLKLKLFVGVFHDDGSLVTGKESEIELALKDGTYQKLAAEGINASLSVAAPSGSYRLRGVVQESVEGKMTAANHAVVIP